MSGEITVLPLVSRSGVAVVTITSFGDISSGGSGTAYFWNSEGTDTINFGAVVSGGAAGGAGVHWYYRRCLDANQLCW